MWYAVPQSVEAMRYKPEGHGFDCMIFGKNVYKFYLKLFHFGNKSSSIINEIFVFMKVLIFLTAFIGTLIFLTDFNI